MEKKRERHHPATRGSARGDFVAKYVCITDDFMKVEMLQDLDLNIGR